MPDLTVTMPRQRGFTLLEVLITLIVFAIGLLTVAGLQTLSKKANYDALQRTTATLLAHDILERMRANAGELDQYIRNPGSELGGSTLAQPAPNCTTATCNPVQMAQWDLWEWERALDGAAEMIGNEMTGGLVTPTACIQGPFGGISGVYTIAIAWRGVTELSNPVAHACGENSGKYGDDDAFRRILVINTYITPTQ